MIVIHHHDGLTSLFLLFFVAFWLVLYIRIAALRAFGPDVGADRITLLRSLVLTLVHTLGRNNGEQRCFLSEFAWSVCALMLDHILQRLFAIFFARNSAAA